MIEEVMAGVVVTKEINTSVNPSVGRLVNNSSSSPAAAAASLLSSSSSSSLSSLLHSGPLRCPRCNSLNTKFCYYNNHSYAQPRHFCRTCRRYWTQGGALRNIPIGGSSHRPKPKSTNLILFGGPSMASPTTKRALPYRRTSAHHLMALLWPNCGPNPTPGPINSLPSEMPNYHCNVNAVTSNVGCFVSAFASTSASAITTTTTSSFAEATATRSASSISESIPLMGSEFGYCLNSACTWPHLPTTTTGSSTFP